jgi:hypothetical protein
MNTDSTAPDRITSQVRRFLPGTSVFIGVHLWFLVRYGGNGVGGGGLARIAFLA